MQGQGESQPGDSVDALSDLANALSGEQEVEQENEAGPEASEGEQDEPQESQDPEEEEGGQDEEQDEAEEPTTVIKHDGKEVTLKQSELIELAQKGFDYTKKTTALADEKKALEPIKAQAEQYRQQNEETLQHSVTQLQAVVQFMEEEIGNPPPIEWAQQDAAYYLAQKELHESRKGKLQKAQQALSHAQQEQARQRQAWLLKQAAETESALKDTLPDWNDAKLNELNAYAGTLGLTPQNAELAFVNKGFWEALHKAKAYDAIQARKAEMKPAKAAPPKVNKPAAANQTGRQIDRAKREAEFNKNPSVEALARILG